MRKKLGKSPESSYLFGVYKLFKVTKMLLDVTTLTLDFFDLAAKKNK